jgi:hydroxymethylpyrimidine pyrophosphatase-like HAD family hydrolase
MTTPAPAIVALDVDGTLFDGAGVDDEATAAVEEAHRSGHVVMIVTGRPWRDLPVIVPGLLPSVTTAVCEHGALMVAVSSGEVTHLTPPVPDHVREALIAACLDSMVLYEATIGFDAVDRPIVEEICGRPGSGSYVVGNKDSIAVVPHGCDKGTGLRRAIEESGIDGHRVIAIGDATNDLPMFAIADVAVAVANADPALVAAGIELTARPFGAGVAEALRRHLPLPAA